MKLYDKIIILKSGEFMGGRKIFSSSKENPLYVHFKLFDNTLYCLKAMKKYCPVIFIFIFLQVISESISEYAWGIVSKFIIQIVQLPVSVEEKNALLIKSIITIFIIGLIITILRCASSNGTWWRYIKIRMGVIKERIEKVLSINYEYLESPEVLDIHQRATRATDGNNNGVEGMMHLMQQIATYVFTLIVSFIAVTVLDWRLILVLVISGILNFIGYKFVIKFEKTRVWNVLAPYWRRINYLNRRAQDFDCAKDIRLFDLNDFLLKKLRGVHEFKENRIDFHENCWTIYSFGTQFLSIISNLCIYGVLIYAVIGKNMSIANFSMYLGFTTAFSNSLIRMLQLMGDYVKCSLEVDDFRSFMKVDNNKNDDKEKVSVPVSSSYTIQFHDVSYQYLDSEKPALNHLNLTIKPGEKLAVVGLNGAGKTTMIKLLLRLYDPTEGYITLNGIDLRKFDRNEYYNLFSPVFQNLEVFAFPISQNVSMKELIDTDKNQVISVMKEAGLSAKLDSLPKGVDTQLLKIVDDSGIDLSGGEKQKLALARALYKNAPIVILDEPTSALDALAEKELYEKFNNMIGNKSSVYISHRLASTRFCDSIAMFMDGKMVEYGTHEQLIEKNGEYAHMFQVQSQYYKDDVKEGGN